LTFFIYYFFTLSPTDEKGGCAMVSFVPFKDLKPGDRFTLKDSELVIDKLSNKSAKAR